MNYNQPYIYCLQREHQKDPQVKLIRLPYPNHLQREPYPEGWPKDDWRLNLICKECGFWRKCGKEDVQWGRFLKPLADETDLGLWCIEIECVQENCGSRSKWHFSGGYSETKETATSLLLNAKPGICCEKEHVLSSSLRILSMCKVSEV